MPQPQSSVRTRPAGAPIDRGLDIAKSGLQKSSRSLWLVRKPERAAWRLSRVPPDARGGGDRPQAACPTLAAGLDYRPVAAHMKAA